MAWPWSSCPDAFQIVPGQPVLVLDVAHNPHSVAALAVNLDAMGFYPTTHAVVGAMADKDLLPMLQRVNPMVDKWYFTDLPLPRAAKAADLLQAWQGQNTPPRHPSQRSPRPHVGTASRHRCGRPG